MILNVPFSSGLLFDSRSLTADEKSIAEKDYLSIIRKCEDKINVKVDSGAVCDAFMGYYINQCGALDNLLSYCDVKSSDEIVSLNPLLTYELGRSSQQDCIKQPNIIIETVVCEDYINIPGLAEKRFKIFDSTKQHVHIPSAKVYTNMFSPKIFGEVVNNFTYPIELVHIFAKIDDVNGNTAAYKHTYTQDTYLKPGQKSGFWVSLDKPVAENAVYSLTSVFQNTTKILPERLQLNVNNPDYNSENNQTKELPTNIANTTGVASGAAMDRAKEILGAAANTTNAPGELMTQANNVLSLASDSASNATQTAMEKTMNILANASGRPLTTMEGVEAINEEANELINAAANVGAGIPNTLPVTGNITNLGNITATNVQVNGIFYDENHEVVDTNSDYINVGKGILPGKQTSFTLTPIWNSENSDKIVSYELSVESSEYSMVSSGQ